MWAFCAFAILMCGGVRDNDRFAGAFSPLDYATIIRRES